MTKGTGQKHFQREDHEHVAHQNEAARHQDHGAISKARPVGKGQGEHAGHPVDEAPEGPEKGQ